MFKVRKDEPDYAFIPNPDSPERNQYGKEITLVDSDDPLAGKSLNINGDSAIGSNPNRYKQHGFYFNADNCISCHACESACSEKNDLPPHLAFRAVGYVEGGTYPAYQRLNISMACNHCDNPVCLKGCPTRAYTKFAEYGAVLQDPDICFGCGYCTWVCPYNAPQLDTTAGHVQKCNMCVDRLEVGLKPACASACLAGALDFGVIETKPENRDQLKTQIPGFPEPDITHPNIRFQQTRSLPREMTRTDSMPLRYEIDEQGDGLYKTKVQANNQTKQWNLSSLRSREDPLVIFTLITQGVVGAFLLLFLGPMLGLEQISNATYPHTVNGMLFAMLAMQTFGLVLSTMHLGRPHRFYRAFNNLRYSPVSREVASIAVFFNLLAAYAITSALPQLFQWIPENLFVGFKMIAGWGAAVSGPMALYFMHRIYRIPARPFWNHWQVLSTFFGSMLSLGGVLVGVVFGAVLLAEGESSTAMFATLSLVVAAGLIIEGIGHFIHGRTMKAQGGEGAASQYQQETKFGKTNTFRNTLMGLSIISAVCIALLGGIHGWWGYAVWSILSAMVLAMGVVGRALFYVLVIPTTMPGAFFWRNQGFQHHAKESGLAAMPQVGVVNDVH